MSMHTSTRRLLSVLLFIPALTLQAYGFVFRINSNIHRGETTSKTTMASSAASSSSSTIGQWTPLTPSDFPTCKVNDRQFAKDENYLHAVLEVWKVNEDDIPVEKASFVYFDESSNAPLYGHLIRRVKTSTSTSKEDAAASIPGILLYHTGAGPHDVFLFYKAYELAQELDDSVIMICDILSDENGWAWGSDRTQYTKVYKSLLEDKWAQMGTRSVAAVDALCTKVQEVDPHRIGVIGWCLGGKPVLELGLSPMSTATIVAMSSFHGVYGRDDDAWKNEEETSKQGQAEIYAFNGQDDPFVSQANLDLAKERLEAAGHTFRCFQMEGAKHGFSNPAQDFNDNPAFSYTEAAAKKGWEETISLFRRRLYKTTE